MPPPLRTLLKAPPVPARLPAPAVQTVVTPVRAPVSAGIGDWVRTSQSTVGNSATTAALLGVPPAAVPGLMPSAPAVPPAATPVVPPAIRPAAPGGVAPLEASVPGTRPSNLVLRKATPPPATAVPAAALGGSAPAVADPKKAAKAGKPEAGSKAAGPAKRLGPQQDPKFRALKKDIATKKHAVASTHPPARTEATNAQDAALPPKDDKEAQGKAANAEKMDAAQPKEFNKAEFVKAVKDAIAKKAPQNLDEADKFADSDKPAQVKAEVQGQVAEGKQSSAADIETTTAAPPDTSKAVQKKVLPLAKDQPPGKPGTPNPAGAIPDKLPLSATDTSDGPAQVNQQMADAQVTEPQLAKSNEPAFKKALDGKHGMEREAPKAQHRMRAHEAGTLADAKGDAAGLGAGAMQDMTGTRVTTGKQVAAGKGTAKGRDETKRAQVTTTLQKVFDAAKKDVEDILTGLDKKVDDQFSREEKAARDAFTAEHKRLMDDYKDKRYSGLTGKGRWVRDLFAGLPEEANRVFVTARDHYVTRMETVISHIADTIAAELKRAKKRIADGKTQLQAAVKALPADLQAIGRQAAGEFADRFEELTEQVNDKGTELVDTLATKYTDALKAVDQEIAAEKEKNKGLVAKVADAVKGVINTIIELKNMLLGILRKAAQAVLAILKDPIGFLGNLVSAVGGGLKLFLRNAKKHLMNGVLAWLLGVGPGTGLQMPRTFDVRGILLLIAGLLGISWANIRARLARKVPAHALAAAETSIPLVSKTKKQGVGGMWDDMKSRVGDLKKNLMTKLVEFLLPTIIIAGVTWIISLLNPASAFIRACKMIIDIIRFIVTQGRQIIEFVNAVLDAVIAIARGGSGGVPGLVERALARSVPVLIGALAAILGLGGIPGRVRKVFQTLSRPVNKAIDWVIDKMIGLIKKLLAKLKRKPKKARTHPHPKDRTPRRVPRVRRRRPSPTKRRPPQKSGPPRKKRADQRTDQQKTAAMQAALREAARLVVPETTVQEIEKKLRPIRSRHRLASLKLVVDRVQGEKILLHFRAAINPTIDGPQLPLPVNIHTIFEVIINQTRDIIKVLRTLATPGASFKVNISGQTFQVNFTDFERAWSASKSPTKELVLDRFRGAMDGHHEWITSAQVIEVMRRQIASQLAQTGEDWITLQHELRSNTLSVVFSPTAAPPKIANKQMMMVSGSAQGQLYSVPQGHPGAVYFPENATVGPNQHPLGKSQTTGHPAFNKELVQSLNKASTPREAAEGAEQIALNWTWDGATPMPHPVHAQAKRKDGSRITKTNQKGHYATIKKLFARIIGGLH